MEVAITDSELEFLQKLRVVHQVESVEHVKVGLRYEYLELVQSRPIEVRIFFIKMRVAESRPSFNIEES